MEIFLFGLIAAGAYLITLTRLVGWKRVLEYSVGVDVLGTIILVLLFTGTYAGMMVGIFSGFTIAVFLTLCKKLQHYNWKDLAYSIKHQKELNHEYKVQQAYEELLK